MNSPDRVDVADPGFAAALRGAIAARGVSLEHLRRALAREGVELSVATLSYWQTGRSRPERASSLAAIGPLEKCLDLPRGFLASRLPPSRRNARLPSYTQAGASRIEEGLLGRCRAAGERLAVPGGLRQAGVHCRFRVVAGRLGAAQEYRTIFVAEEDGVESFPLWVETEDPGSFPVVTATTNCRVGRVVEYREPVALAVEMLLDRPLRRGEACLVEYTLTHFARSAPFTDASRAVSTSVREVMLEVQFVPDDLPSSLVAFSDCGGVREEKAMVVGATVQAHFTDRPAGVFGVRWSW